MSTITKSELIDRVAKYMEIKKNADKTEEDKQVRVTKKDTGMFIETFTEVLTDILADGDKIALIGFMSMETVDVPEKECRNPQTGENIISPAHKKVKVKIGKSLKDAVNGITE